MADKGFEFDLGDLTGSSGGQRDPSAGLALGTGQPAAKAQAESAAPPSQAVQTTDVADFLAGIEEEFKVDQQIDREAARKTQAVNEKLRKSGVEYNKDAQIVEQQIDQIERDRETSLRLADSNNPIDRLELLGSQVLNPGRFTRDGRQNRAREASNLLTIRGQIHNVEIASAESSAAAIAAEAATKKAMGAGSLERFQTRVTALEALQREAIATEGLRKTALSKQTPRMIQQTLAGPKNGAGYHQMGDFLYSESELLTRNRELQNQELMNSMPLNSFNSEAMYAWQQVQAANMSHADLLELRESGYKSGDITWNPDVIENNIQRFTAIEAQNRQDEATALAEGTLFATSSQEALIKSVKESQAVAERAELEFDINSPLGRAAGELTDSLNSALVVGEQMAEGVTDSSGKTVKVPAPMVRAQQLKMITEANRKFYEAVQTQAKRDAGADKALVPILQNRILGAETDPGMIQSYVVDRFAAGKDFSQGLDPRVAAEVNRLATELTNQQMAEFAQANYGGMSPAMTAQDKSDVRRVAAQAAFEEVVAEKSAKNLNDATSSIITDRQGPLIKAGVPPSKVATLEDDAAKLAFDMLLSDDVSPEQLQTVLEKDEHELGWTQDRGDELRDSYNAAQPFAMFDLIEAYGAEVGVVGLGDRVIDNLIENLPERAQQVNSLNKQDAPLYDSMTRTTIQQATSIFGEAKSTAKARQTQVATAQVMKLKSPTITIASAIDQIRNVDSNTKSRVYFDIVLPTIENAKKQGLGVEEQMASAMSALEVGVEGDPNLTRAGKLVLKAMPQLIEAQQSLIATYQKSITDSDQDAGLSYMMGKRTPGESLEAARRQAGPARATDWYTDGLERYRANQQ